MVTKALELSPTRTHLYYALGRSYLVVGQAKEAIESFKKAREISPKVSDAHLNYIAALITIKDFEGASEAISEMKAILGRDLIETEYSRIAFMYNSVNEVGKAIEIMEESKDLYPEHLDNLGQLVTYYLAAGETGKAIEIAEIMAQIDPSLANKLDQFKMDVLKNNLQL